MAQTAEALEATRDEAFELLQDLDERIARARLDGAPASTLSRLRKRREAAVRDADEAEDARLLLEQREREAAETAKQRKLAEARARAREAAEEHVATARAVDEALAELERAYEAHRLAGIDLSVALRAARLSDGGRILMGLAPAARWALWGAAPAFAEASGSPRTPANRRRPLAESAARVAPAIPEGAGD